MDFIVETDELSISEIINALESRFPSAFETRRHTPSDSVHGRVDRKLVHNYMTAEGKPEAHFVDFVQNSYMTAEGEPVDV